MKDIKVKNKEETVLPYKNIHYLEESSLVVKISKRLSLPIFKEIKRGIKGFLEATELGLMSEYYLEKTKIIIEDPEEAYRQAVTLVINAVPTIIENNKRVYEEYKDTKFLADYNDAHEIVLQNQEQVLDSLEDLLGLFDFYLIDLFCNEKTRLHFLIEWYIKYAPLDLLRDNELLNKLADRYYKLFISRLPADELFEFLTSEREGARIMAKNKVKGV